MTLNNQAKQVELVLDNGVCRKDEGNRVRESGPPAVLTALESDQLLAAADAAAAEQPACHEGNICDTLRHQRPYEQWLMHDWVMTGQIRRQLCTNWTLGTVHLMLRRASCKQRRQRRR